MRERRGAGIAHGHKCPRSKLLGGSVETEIEIEAGDSYGLAIGVFE